MLRIRSLENQTIENLYTAFNEAFKDYNRQWNPQEFRDLLQRRGFVPQLSFGAFDDEKLVSFTFNCIGDFNGKKTAYDAGTGTIEAYRGKGLSTQIFRESIPHLKAAIVEQYLLETQTTNHAAISVYQKIGFQTTRELNYFVQQTAEVKMKPVKENDSLLLKEIDLQEAEKVQHFFDFVPSWQNTFTSLRRTELALKVIGAFIGEELFAYGIIVPETGDIPQMAVNKTHRRKGIGTALFSELIKHNQNSTTRIINIDAGCTHITSFLAAQNISALGAQYEMVMRLK